MVLDGKIIDISKPVVMGILNLTPDSFFDGGKLCSKDDIRLKIVSMADEGASIIDVGGYSSGAGADDICDEEEIDRIMPAIEIIRNVLPEMPVSVDTFRSSVVKAVVSHFGGIIVNDISGGEIDEKMIETVAMLKLPYICMHMRGTPQTMQQFTRYEDIVNEIIEKFSFKIRRFRTAGIHDIICDPGFGFSKTIEQNFELLNKLEYFKLLDVPILAGLSRKSMIWKTLDITPQEALNGTTALNMIALEKGATILRVHDIAPAIETIRLFHKLHNLR